MTTCSTCKGEGTVWRSIPSFNGKRRGVEFKEWCPDCQGSGRIDDEPLASETGPNAIKSVTYKRRKNGSTKPFTR